MRIVVTHLTRMRAPFICVAGLDLETGKHVRPVLESGQLGLSLLRRHGGPFDIAAIVELGPVRYVGSAPETEDYRFERRKARRVGAMAQPELRERLQAAACTALGDVFGDSLQRQGDTYAADTGGGRASLGYVIPAEPPLLLVNEHDKVRLRLRRAGHNAWLPVTDLRLYAYQDDQFIPRRDAVERLSARMSSGTRVILGVGLTRPMFGGGGVKRHWLQINNIHIVDDPLWQENDN